ncbi:hypothetical protein PM023_14510 [Halorubrum ezzemoulense]|jgi:hypothetical protein|uniref:hypothetical protein n=1 Tax=Halorubrum ezzemoulense TaxID=337243 RepID=UPI002330FFA2|nr:hypothetical protein [Halorubrum ezzemoulense]MDB2225879.1 hypothetical protein [Halorubrum ezzemoulense]
MSEREDQQEASLSLSEIDSTRTLDEKQMDGKSGEILYQLKFHKRQGVTTEVGKVTEIGMLEDSPPVDLQALQTDTYTHYAIFRLKDRSTTLIVQDKSGETYKALSLGKDTVKVPYAVSISSQS